LDQVLAQLGVHLPRLLLVGTLRDGGVLNVYLLVFAADKGYR
jgi:hypothetical protein